MNNQPLAMKMRPTQLSDIIGQSHILGKDSLLTKMIETDMLRSIILYGAPGTGKTTIANVIANVTDAQFIQINAVTAGKKDIADACAEAKYVEENKQQKTILFIDEIHRFNKAQQDYLLPFVENGTVILIGATTENPYFEVNSALVSRSVLFELKPIEPSDIEQLLTRTMLDSEKGLGDKHQTLSNKACEFIATQANGDCRFALSILELASVHAGDNNPITELDVEAVIQKPHLYYDKNADMHYDTISAFIKSIRGSDPDAALYYLARMLEAGEDVKFIARRIMIAASEDIGNADPMALIIAVNASLAVERIGMPESNLILSQAVLYLAMAPKSNSATTGIQNATAYIKTHPSNTVPDHLKDAHYKSAAKLGHGLEYLYPHNFTNHWVSQQYLPSADIPQFYKNSHVGYEAIQAEYQNKIRK